MSDVLHELVAILSLERIEENIFRGAGQNLGWDRVFGGQVVGQALSAAEQTVPQRRSVHSLHSYFLHGGIVPRPPSPDVAVCGGIVPHHRHGGRRCCVGAHV